VKSDAYYLKSNVMAEPLVDGWYAWTHLIPPATAARNLTERHIRIMDSYIASPETHEAAVRNPALLGGPFMDLGRNRVDEVKALRDRTLNQRSHLVSLSRSIEQLDAMLREKAAGYSLRKVQHVSRDTWNWFMTSTITHHSGSSNHFFTRVSFTMPRCKALCCRRSPVTTGPLS
jgi:hypothetical protein